MKRKKYSLAMESEFVKGRFVAAEWRKHLGGTSLSMIVLEVAKSPEPLPSALV